MARCIAYNMEKYVNGWKNMSRHKHLKFIGIHFIVQKGICLFLKLFLECWQFKMVNLETNKIFKIEKKKKKYTRVHTQANNERTNGVEKNMTKRISKSVKCICV